MSNLVFVESRSYNPLSYAQRLQKRAELPYKRKAGASQASQPAHEREQASLPTVTHAPRPRRPGGGDSSLQAGQRSRPCGQQSTPTPSTTRSRRHSTSPRALHSTRQSPPRREDRVQQHTPVSHDDAQEPASRRTGTPPYRQDYPLPARGSSSPEPSPSPPSRKRARPDPGLNGRSTGGPNDKTHGSTPAPLEHTQEEDKHTGGVKCRVCAKVQSSHYRCRSCDFSLCPHCVVNAALVHPEHAFEGQARERVPEIQAASAQCDVCDLELGDERYACLQCRNTYFCPSCRRIHPAHHTLVVIPRQAVQTVQAGPISRPVCDVCDRDLPGVRYECQDCFGINFCVSCQHIHPANHTLFRIGPDYTFVNGRVIEELSDSGVLGGSETGGAGDIEHGGGPGTDNGVEDHDPGYSIVRRTTAAPEDTRAHTKQPRQHQAESRRPRITITLSVEGLVSAEQIAKGLMQTAKQLLGQSKEKNMIDGVRMQAVSGESASRDDRHRRREDRDAGRGGWVRESAGVAGTRRRIEQQSIEYDSEDEHPNPLNNFDVPDNNSTLNSDSDMGSDLVLAEPAAASAARRQWSQEDLDQLRNLMAKGWALHRIAASLGRSTSAVSQRWRIENPQATRRNRRRQEEL